MILHTVILFSLQVLTTNAIADYGQDISVKSTPKIEHYLIQLNGNSSVLVAQSSAFMSLLQNSLANLTDSESLDIVVNELSFKPFFVNVSLFSNLNISRIKLSAENNSPLFHFNNEYFSIINFMSEKEMFIPKPHYVSQLHAITQTTLLIIASILLFLCSCIFIYIIIRIHYKSRKNRRASTPDCGFKNGIHQYTEIDIQNDPEVSTDILEKLPSKVSNNNTSPSRSPVPLRKKSTKLPDNSVHNFEGLHMSSKDLTNGGVKSSPRPTRNSTGTIRHKPPPPRRSSSLITTIKTPRPLSVPAPCHLANAPVEPFSYPRVISTEDIEKDVIYVLTTLEDVEDEEEEILIQEN